MIDLVIIDYGVGNLLSVARSFEKNGFRPKISSDTSEILSAHKVVLPGVGAFPRAMEKLKLHKLDLVVKELALRGTPLLAICLGMQLLLEESEEFGITPGLGLIPGRVIAIPEKSTEGHSLTLPHIGWNKISRPNKSTIWRQTVLRDINEGEFLYFVHSFMVVPTNAHHILGQTFYGGHPIPAIISHGNLIGCQFHPEKSGKTGLHLIRNFALS